MQTAAQYPYWAKHPDTFPLWAERQETRRERLAILFYLGHFIDSFSEKDGPTWDMVRSQVKEEEGDDRYTDAVESYQSFCLCDRRQPIQVDGKYGAITRSSLFRRFCLHPDRTKKFDCTSTQHEFGGGQPRFDLSGGGAIAVWTDMSLGALNVALDLESKQWWSSVCGALFVGVSSKDAADIFSHARRIDGDSNTLAWSESPNRNQVLRANGGRRQLEQRFDTGDIRTYSDRQSAKVINTHETGHAIHMDGHTNDRNDIMYPSFSGPRESFGANEIRFMQQAYGLPTDSSPPPPNGGEVYPVSAVLSVELSNGKTLFGPVTKFSSS